MTRVYVPWPQRPARSWRGLSAGAASAAVGIARFAAPILQRHAGLILTLAIVVACLGCWAIAQLLAAAAVVQDLAVLSRVAGPGEWLSLAEIRALTARLRSAAPPELVWLVQSSIVRDLIGIVGVVGFVNVLAIFAIWWERKVAGHIQSRLGPMRVGGWHGWSQSLADGIKLLSKEDLIPAGADRPLFRLAPYLAFVPALLAFLALPFGAYWVLRELDVSLLLVVALLGLEVLGVLLAGWASNNKWSMYGAVREAAQVVGYEIPMMMALLVPVMVAQSMRLTAIAEAQAGGWFNWLAFHSPWTFATLFLFFISSLAACKRAPFDLPEAESELVAGFHTEYSGFRWALFFFAEYAAMFVAGALVVLLFLGGWDAPWAGMAPRDWDTSANPAIQILYGVLFGGPIWFVLKTLFIVYVQMWLRWTLPRPRIDQVLYSCIQVMLPLMMFVLVASAAWELALQHWRWLVVLNSLLSAVLGLVGLAVAGAILYIGYFGFRRGRVLVGPMAVERPLPGG